MKEVYSATDNFNASNFIGQGVAGENLCDLVLVLKNAYIFNKYFGLNCNQPYMKLNSIHENKMILLMFFKIPVRMIKALRKFTMAS